MPTADGTTGGEKIRLLRELPQTSKLASDDCSIADFAGYLENRLLPGGSSHCMLMVLRKRLNRLDK